MFKVFNYTNPNIIFELKNQKSIICETDTVIGILSLSPDNIYKIKKRKSNKKIIKFILNYDEIGFLSKIERKFLDKFWPGPITIIKNKKSYRIPNDDFILYLLKTLNRPLYCSSANISGNDVIKNIEQANDEFDPNKLFFDLILVDWHNPNKINLPSTIINIDDWKILRKGALFDEIKTFINDEVSSKIV